jgi:RND family efflux transporter MFP subunit
MQANNRSTTTTQASPNGGHGSNGQPTTPPLADEQAPPRGGQTGHGGDEHVVPDDLPPVSRGATVLIGVVVLALFGGLFLLGWIPHRHKQAEAAKDAHEAVEAKPVVDVATPSRSDATIELNLPANVEAYQRTSMYARTSGYLKPLSEGIDIGADVKKGQLLAEIAAPEVDAQLEEAKAALLQAQVTVERANKENAFAKGTYDRYIGLSKTGGVTGQQLEEKRVALSISESSKKNADASVAVADAAIKRLTATQQFQQIVAPFDGVITARNFDAGALISATNARELFRVEQIDRLRVFVNVPQTYAMQVRNRQEAELFVRDVPGMADKPFKGTVARSAEAIDPSTRTMRVEIDVPNPDRTLKSGTYGQVKFKIRLDQPPMVVPTSALVFGQKGMTVALVEAGEKVRFQEVRVGRDFGAEAEVTGLTGAERVVTNPGDRLADGVEVALHKKAGKPAGGAGAGGNAVGGSPAGGDAPATVPAAGAKAQAAAQ